MVSGATLRAFVSRSGRIRESFPSPASVLVTARSSVSCSGTELGKLPAVVGEAVGQDVTDEFGRLRSRWRGRQRLCEAHCQLQHAASGMLHLDRGHGDAVGRFRPVLHLAGQSVRQAGPIVPRRVREEGPSDSGQRRHQHDRKHHLKRDRQGTPAPGPRHRTLRSPVLRPVLTLPIPLAPGTVGIDVPACRRCSRHGHAPFDRRKSVVGKPEATAAHPTIPAASRASAPCRPSTGTRLWSGCRRCRWNNSAECDR